MTANTILPEGSESPDVFIDLLFIAQAKGDSKMVQRILKSIWDQESLTLEERLDTVEYSPSGKNNVTMIDILCQASIRGRKTLISQILAFHKSAIALKGTNYCEPLACQTDRVRKKTALMYACEEGHVSIVETLLDSQACVNSIDYAGWTALMLACHGGFPLIVSKLLDCKADINIADSEGMTAFMLACMQGHVEVVQLLLEQEGDLMTPSTFKTHKTALMFASENGHSAVVRALLTHHQNGIGTKDIIDRVDVDRWSSLMMASLHDHVQVFKILCDSGADMNIVSNQGQTAYNIAGPGIRMFLHVRSQFPSACKNGDEKTIETLLEDMSSLLLPPRSVTIDDFISDEDDKVQTENDVWDSKGKTPLILACRFGLSTQLVGKLIDMGSDINKVDSKGRSALMHASYRGHDKIVQLLLENNADESLVDNNGKKSEVYARETRRPEIVKLLQDRSKAKSTKDSLDWGKQAERISCSSLCSVM